MHAILPRPSYKGDTARPESGRSDRRAGVELANMSSRAGRDGPVFKRGYCCRVQPHFPALLTCDPCEISSLHMTPDVNKVVPVVHGGTLHVLGAFEQPHECIRDDTSSLNNGRVLPSCSHELTPPITAQCRCRMAARMQVTQSAADFSGGPQQRPQCRRGANGCPCWSNVVRQ